MFMKLLVLSFVAALAIAAGSGCGSSASVPGNEGSDTTMTAQATPDTGSAVTPRPERKQMGFVAQDDTIEAQVLTKREGGRSHKPSTGVVAKKTSPAPRPLTGRKFYAVQIGAFRVAGNSSRCVATARKRFKEPVREVYEKKIALQRVLVGEFASLRRALEFLGSLKKEYPREYADAWVAEMLR